MVGNVDVLREKVYLYQVVMSSYYVDNFYKKY